MRNKNIFIVDDDLEIRNLLKEVLNNQGYIVQTYSNGINFFEDIKTTVPDVIILDIMMSWLDGLDICSILKNNESYKNIPVLIITAFKDKDLQQKIKNSKADDYLYKPFNLEVLCNTIEKYIGKAK